MLIPYVGGDFEEFYFCFHTFSSNLNSGNLAGLSLFINFSKSSFSTFNVFLFL